MSLQGRRTGVLKTKVMSDIINEFLFADDCALNTATEADMQHNIDKFSAACNNFGLTISTEVMHQLAPGKPMLNLTSISMDNA